MGQFVRITDVDGDRMLLNLDHIVWLSKDSRTISTLVGSQVLSKENLNIVLNALGEDPEEEPDEEAQP